MNHESHHPLIMKRMYRNPESYPHLDPKKQFLDQLIFVIGALGPVFTLPQIYTIFAHKNAAGVSAFSWFAYFLFSIVWLIYGVVHKEKAIIFTYSLWILINGLVSLGAIIY